MKEKILELLDSHSYTPSQLYDLMQLTSADSFKKLVKELADLEEKGQIHLQKNGTFTRNSHRSATLEGVFRSNEKGFGFVSVEGMDDIYIPKHRTAAAMSGDRVVVSIDEPADVLHDLGAEGHIVEIVERKTTQIVGEFIRYSNHLIQSSGYMGYIIPTDRKLSGLTCFVSTQGVDAVDGTICIAEIVSYPTEENPTVCYGILTKEIGFKDAPGVDILTILNQFGIPTQFKESVLEQANGIAMHLTEEEVRKRVDLRQEIIITIDGEDAKDLDDAISLNILDNGHYELGVHIADVSHYVTENTPLDTEAYERGTSVYLTDRVVPMLPQRLSNGICSLHPEEDRLAMSCVMTINASGEIVDYRLFESVICSKKRMTYTEVNRVLNEKNVLPKDAYAPFLTMLQQLNQLHYALYHERKRRGAIDFESQESKIIVDTNGKAVDIVLRERGVAEKMIESFMLAANETVAKHFMKKTYPFLYRIHEKPNEEKMQRFMEFVTNFGIMMKGTKDTVSSKMLQQVLAKAENQPYEMIINTLLLRSMQQAKYAVEPLGHYGLATPFYTHFTSPIRRYPDLIVHRLIKQYEKCAPSKEDNGLIEKLVAIAEQSSKMERRSVEAERETEIVKKVEYMSDKIGRKFEGIIKSITRFGIFVELPNTVEGLIHVSQMTDDHYQFIDNHLLLVGKRTGKVYQIGDQVTIVVDSVDVDAQTIDFKFTSSKKTAISNEKKQVTKKKMKRYVKKKKRKR